MEQKSKNYSEMRIIINVKDFLARICLRWRAMLLFALIFALLFDALGAFKDYKRLRVISRENELSIDEKINTELEKANENINGLRHKLSVREIAEVDRVVDSYDNVLKRYDDLLKYGNESIKMQLDPNCVSMLTLQYNLDNHFKVEYPIIGKKDNTNTILDALSKRILNDETCAEMAKAIGEEKGFLYISEMVSITQSEGNLVIQILGRNQDECIQMGKAIKNSVVKESKELKNVFGSFDLNFLMENYTESPDNDVLSEQTAHIISLNTMKTAYNNLTTTLNDNQRELFYALLDERNINEDTFVEDMNEENNSLVVSFIHVKYIFVGFILGIILVAGFESLKYVLTERLRTKEDIENVYGIELLGEIPLDKEAKSFVDNFLTTLFYGKGRFSKEDKVQMACAGIRIAVKKRGWNKVFVTSTSMDESVREIISECIKRIDEKSMIIETGRPIIFDPEAYEKMSDSECVIIVEKIRDSKYEDIKKELQKCDAVKVPVIGCVVVE